MRGETIMPLMDHFAPPMENELPWTSLLSSWAVMLATRLNQWLPEQFVAHNDIKIMSEIESPLKSYDPATVTVAPDRFRRDSEERPRWEVPAPRYSFPRTKGDHVEVYVRDEDQVWSCHPAVVSFVTPTNKETLQQRRAFLSRCVSHLHEGASLAIIDIVTRFPFCLYNDLLTLLGAEEVPRLPSGTRLFAAAFRPVSRGDRSRTFDPDERLETDVWVEPVAIGQPLPTLPLRLIYDEYAPVEFEPPYHEVCRSHRLI
jgi:hypothetical protein